jgi:hypothetical protein
MQRLRLALVVLLASAVIQGAAITVKLGGRRISARVASRSYSSRRSPLAA